jgi:hypothetical protein
VGSAATQCKAVQQCMPRDRLKAQCSDGAVVFLPGILHERLQKVEWDSGRAGQYEPSTGLSPKAGLMPKAGLIKGLYAANRWGSMAACTEVRASNALAMLEYKQQNPADTPAAIRLLFGGIDGRDTMECTHTCQGNCWRPGHVVYRYKSINAEQKWCPGARPGSAKTATVYSGSFSLAQAQQPAIARMSHPAWHQAGSTKATCGCGEQPGSMATSHPATCATWGRLTSGMLSSTGCLTEW